jgi:hypothetical protein
MFELALRLKVRLQSPDLLRALVSMLKGLRDKFDDRYMSLMKGREYGLGLLRCRCQRRERESQKAEHDWNYIRFLARSLENT